MTMCIAYISTRPCISPEPPRVRALPISVLRPPPQDQPVLAAAQEDLQLALHHRPQRLHAQHQQWVRGSCGIILVHFVAIHAEYHPLSVLFPPTWWGGRARGAAATAAAETRPCRSTGRARRRRKASSGRTGKGKRTKDSLVSKFLAVPFLMSRLMLIHLDPLGKRTEQFFLSTAVLVIQSVLQLTTFTRHPSVWRLRALLRPFSPRHRLSLVSVSVNAP